MHTNTDRISAGSPRPRKRARWLWPSLAVGIGGCVCCPPQEFTGCVDFESLQVGTKYEFQDVFFDSGTVMTVESFQWGDGRWTTGNFARVENQGEAGGSGQDLAINNVNVRFDFGAYGVNGLSFAFGELGGNLNLQVNGEFRNFENFAEINGDTVGATSVSVQNGLGNDTGDVTLSGKVLSISLGGQEFWVDDVCTP